jgi:hypothetical protein
MSAKNTLALVPKINDLYIGEEESENWNETPTDRAILAFGSGCYSEPHFGLYHSGRDVITQLRYNAYPVSNDSSFTIKLKVSNGEEEYEYPETFTFSGKMESKKNLNLRLPFEDNQIVFYYVGNSGFPDSLVRIRLYINIQE